MLKNMFMGKWRDKGEALYLENFSYTSFFMLAVVRKKRMSGIRRRGVRYQ